MIKETGRVVAIEPDYLWLETINRGTCGTCAAEKGCGQSLLARWMSKKNYLKVSLDGRKSSSYKINDVITIGIPNNVVVLSSLLIYCLPLLLLITGAAIGQSLFANDLAAIIGSVVGVLLGSGIVRLISVYQQSNRNFRPVIIDMIDTGTIA